MKKRLIKLASGRKMFLTENQIAIYAAMKDAYTGGTASIALVYVMQACEQRAIELGLKREIPEGFLITIGSRP